MRKRRLNPPIREFADRGVQWLLDTPEILKGLLFAGQIEVGPALDYSKATLMPNRYIRDNLRKQESDLIYRIPFLPTGPPIPEEIPQEVLVYLMLEHQSRPDLIMFFRMLKYMVGEWDKQLRQFQDQKLPESEWKFLPMIPMVFYTGRQPWESPIPLKELMHLPPILARHVPQFDILFFNLKATPEKELLASGHPFGWVLRVIQKEFAPLAELEAALMEAMEQLSKTAAADRELWEKAVWYLYLLVNNRRTVKEGAALAEKIQEKVIETRGKREGTKMANTMAEVYIEQGHKKGVMETQQNVLLGLMREKFGALPEAVEVNVRSMEDTAALDTLIKRVLWATSLDAMELGAGR